ncbi:MAG: hypothetical protein PHX44_00320 [Sulfurimonas sp.]|uniref:hypothetical protein n=1 Tax=Sulfurimonas sp. TaxID=2022749 RepID=UPI00261143CF|nr:hypothetical protein [Sulfurimonas sp.]MDD2651480.1 hypothetical protein [Sulfurimonas sp.]MDD3451021.1 hypothetical protein [Sulfurimonas sp.]
MQHKIIIVLSLIITSLSANVSQSEVISASRQSENIVWEAKVDFAGGYYDTFYHKGRFVAIPSMYNKNADYRPVANPKNIETCHEKWKAGGFGERIEFNHVLLDTNDADQIASGEALLYKAKLPISKINDVVINEMSGWRVPNQRYSDNENAPALKLWKENQCFREGRLKDRYRIDYFYTRWIRAQNMGDGKWWYYNHGDWNDPVILVRTASDIEKTVYEDKSLDTRGKIKRLAELLTKAELTPVKKTIAVPVMLNFPPAPTFTKGEFETTADFEKRKSLIFAEWEKSKQITQEKNKVLMEQYEKQLQEADAIYQTQISKLDNESIKQQIYEKSMKYALSVVLGKPYFKDLKYDADTQKMRGIVFAANDSSFQSSVEFDVALSVAKTFKQDIQDNKYVPLISFDDTLSVSSVKVVSNESLKKFKQQQIAAQNQKQKEKDEEARKQAAKDAEAQKRQAQENKLYNQPKNIGDKVCNKMQTCGLFGCDSYEVSAFVEGKSGDRIQIRIADPKVMRSYKGVDIYQGSLLWDQYNNWKPCN